MFVSFVIPAHNEADLIQSTIRSVKWAASDCGALHEIIVVDDGSEDGTGEIARAAGATVVRVDRRQISATRNAGAAVARGKLLFFVDADTTIAPAVLRSSLEALRSGAVGGGARIQLDEPVPFYAKSLLALLEWIVPKARFMAGCYMFCTRSAFDSVGGFDERLFAAEEVRFGQTLHKVGRVVIVPEQVVTSGRKLRVYSAREIFGRMFGLMFRGVQGLYSRDHLDLWYGDRREDRDRVA